MITKFLTAAAATVMVAAPVAASAAPAAPTTAASSLSVTRASAPTTGTNKAVPGGNGLAIALGALLAGGIIYAVVDNVDNDNDSDSN